LQFFVWALRSHQNQKVFEELIEGREARSIWSLDPTVIRAINFAIGEKLCERIDGSITTTTAGQAFAARLRAVPEIFHDQLSFLEKIGKSVSEKKIKQIAKEWALENA
jgi:hypothetical protein